MYHQREKESIYKKIISMKQVCKILALVMTVMFLLQSCVAVRQPRHRHHRHHHHHRHCCVIKQQTPDSASFNYFSAECLAESSYTAYEDKG